MYPTPYRVSTITTTGSLGCIINLDELFKNIDTDEIDTKIAYVEYGKRKFDNSFCKGQVKKTIQMGTKSKRFDNQVTVLYKDDAENIYVSAKIFKNGNLQMTGVKTDEQGHMIMEKIRNIIAKAYEKNADVLFNEPISVLVPSNYSIRLINSDFKMGFPIRRDLLFKIMIRDYENGCSYEPCIYPGVKIQYFHNDESTPKDGVCRCEVPCVFKKKGDNSGCRKVTIAVFQSGSVIITGAQKLSQIDDVYAFITNVLRTQEDNIKKVVLVDEQGDGVAAKPEIKKVILNGKNIIYPKSMLAKEKEGRVAV